jgi:hypothetical protein
MGRALAPALLPAYIRSLGQESALTGKSLGNMTLRAPASVSPAVDEKEREMPGYISFSLGSADAAVTSSQNISGNNR